LYGDVQRHDGWYPSGEQDSTAGIEGIGDVLRHAPGRDHDDVEADIAPRVGGVVRELQLRRGDDARFAALGDGFDGVIGVLARLDLDKDKRAQAPRHDAVALGDEKHGRGFRQ
jgi:hypothetical protein